MKFSIVIPSYNEENDIRSTMESVTTMDWPDYEVIVVDDSNDKTPEIVKEYASKGVRLIKPAIRKGRCEARNIGIKDAQGEVVVILNADTRLPKDFLKKLDPIYKSGADYVLVKSEIENWDDLFARYVECLSLADYYVTDPDRMEWTEGYSCRRDIAVRAGLFPSGFAVPIVAGEDAFFGNNVKALKAKKVLADDIVVRHIAPHTFEEYWQIRKGRGAGSPQIRRFLEKWSFPRIYTRAILRIGKNVLTVLTIIPITVRILKLTKFSPKGIVDFFPFMYAWIIEQAAFTVGEFQSAKKIIKAEKKLKLNQ
ncbi:MAG: glycosyltransferase [Pseudobdellovibrio sp.]|nr:glycosyltransferase [Pseudobdellovibrio sp.]